VRKQKNTLIIKLKNVFYYKNFSLTFYSNIFLQLSSRLTIALNFAGGILTLSWVLSNPYLTSTYYSSRLRIVTNNTKTYFY